MPLTSPTCVLNSRNVNQLVETPQPVSTIRGELKNVIEASLERTMDQRAPLSDTGQVQFPRVGDIFRGFTIIEELGSGGFGRVYLAEQVNLADRPVALKVTTRPTTEPERLASLQHTNIVPVYSVHTELPLQAICMPYLGRTTLADLKASWDTPESLPRSGSGLLTTLRNGKSVTKSPEQQPVTEVKKQVELAPNIRILEKMSYTDAVVWLMSQIAAGLAHAHERGILHLDLKPANILLTDEAQPMILDFGLAYDRKKNIRTGYGGTLRYMSPEQIEEFIHTDAIQLDERVDLYALGVIFYELVTGQHPYPASLQSGLTHQEVRAIRLQPPPPIRRMRKISPAIEAIILTLLQPDPRARYRSASDLTIDLERHQNNLPLRSIKNPSLLERMNKYRLRHPLLAMCLVAGFFATTAIGMTATAANQVHKRYEAEAENQFSQLHRAMNRLRIDLLSFHVPANRQSSLAQASEWSELYRLDENSWHHQDQVYFLKGDNKQQLEQDLYEMATLAGHAEYMNALSGYEDRRSSLEKALTWNDRALKLEKNLSSRHYAARWDRFQILTALGQEPDESTQQPGQEPGNSFDRFFAGVIAYTNADRPVAAKHFEHLLETKPDDAAGRVFLGLSYQEMGRYAAAAEQFEIAKALDPKDARPVICKGELLFSQGRLKEAVVQYGLALKLDPSSARTYYNRAITHLLLREFDKAWEDAQLSAKHGTPEFRQKMLEIRVLQALGKKEESQRLLKQVDHLEPQDEFDLVVRGLASMATQPAQAMKDFEAAIKKNKNYVAAYQNLAHLYSEVFDQPKKSAEMLEKVLEIFPEFAPGLTGKAVLDARSGERKLAHELVQKALRYSQNPMDLYRIACVYSLTAKDHPEDLDNAFYYLKRAFRAGFKDFKLMESDPDLATARENEEYKKVLAAARVLSY